MKRTFLFLQGPHGPFFKQLGQHFKSHGHNIVRVNFNGGDWIDWCGADTLSFVEDQDSWADYVVDLFKQKKVTDIVLYGDCRSLHKVAIREAERKRLRVHVFEEGYIRPKWITYENGGVNGNSHLIDSIELLAPLADDVEEIPAQKVGPSMRWILFYCLRYYLFKALRSFRFSCYVRHRPYRPKQEFLLWLGNLLRMPLLHRRSNQRREQLFQNKTPFFLAVLQLDSDAQLREHSKYLSMAEFVNEILRSFAEHAPKDCHLVFKKHPYDPNAIPYETLVRLEAYSLGIRSRVLFLHSGSLPELIKQSRGVVLMNSTVGTSALHHGKPTIALGRAIYNIPGLTWQGSLADFWQGVKGPDIQLFRAFRAHLMSEALVNGGFFTPAGRQLAITGCVGRMLSAQPLVRQAKVAKVAKEAKVVQLKETGS
jgi:capsular polysaccharide export protein